MTGKQTEDNLQNPSDSIENKHIAKPNLIKTTKDNYGENYQAHLLDQYKLYVTQADIISARRTQMNKFYISLFSGLLTLISIASAKNILPNFPIFMLLLVEFLGFLFCCLWFLEINSYKQLNSAKFKVIYEMEQYLPFASYEQEWYILKRNKSHGGYLNQTKIEQYIPLALAFTYLCLLITSIFYHNK